ncbi:O-antigen ligase family protein [Planctomycetota bacterium]
MELFKGQNILEKYSTHMRPVFLFMLLSIVGILTILAFILVTESLSPVLVMLLISGLIALFTFFVAGARNKERILMAAFLLALPISMGKMVASNLESTKTTVSFLLQIYLSDILLFMFIIVWSINFLSNRYHSGVKFWQNQNKFIIPLLLWICMGFISLVPAIDRTAAAVGVVQMLRIFVTFFAVFHFIKGRKEIYFILNCLLIACFIQSLLMFAQYATDSMVVSFPGDTMSEEYISESLRPAGTIGNSSNFAKFSGLMLPIALAYIFFAPRVRNKLFFLSIWICGSVALILTLSRAGLAAWIFSIGLFFAGIIIFRIVTMRKLAPFFLAIVFLICISSGILWWVGGESLKSRIAFDEGSSAARMPMWKVAVNVIKAHPIAGVGLKNYTLVHQNYDNTRYHISAVLPDSCVHNLFLLYAAEIGIPGLFFFLWFVWELLRGALRCARSISLPMDKVIYLSMAIGVINILLQSITGMGVVNHLIHLSTIAIFAAIVAKQGLTLSNSQGKAKIYSI